MYARHADLRLARLPPREETEAELANSLSQGTVSGKGSVHSPQASDERRKISGSQTSVSELLGAYLGTKLLEARKRTVGEV